MGYGDHWQQARKTRRSRRSARSARTTAPRSCCSAETPKRTCARRRITAASRPRSTRRRSAPARRATVPRSSSPPASSRDRRRSGARRCSSAISRRTGWSGSEDARFPDGMTLTTASVASPPVTNVSVPSVTFSRASFSGQERVTVTAGIAEQERSAGGRRPGHARDRRPRICRPSASLSAQTRRGRYRSRRSRSRRRT